MAFSEIEAELSKCGFKYNIQDGVICRWETDGIQVDIMPTDPKIFGFSNIWYGSTVKHAKKYLLEKDLEILLIEAPYLLATKIEAFESRGDQDFYGSHDLEDMITILDGRKSIIKEIESSDLQLKNYLSNKFQEYLNNIYFKNAIPGHLAPYQSVANERAEILKNNLLKIVSINLIKM
jgi:hypothetical protein